MKRISEFAWITLGTLFIAVGIYFFSFPNNFSIGGVSGLSIIMSSVFPSMSRGYFMLVINLALLLICLIFLGKMFFFKTIYSSLLLSASVFLLEKFFPMNAAFTDQPLLELIFSVALPAAGSAIVFNHYASTGGTDIIAMLLKKYSHIDIGIALFLSDAAITIISGFIFGIKTGLFSFLGLVTTSLIIDNIMESINTSKYFTIITETPQEIYQYVNATLERGATLLESKGTYSHTTKNIILTVVDRSQAMPLKKFIKSIDKNAFIIIANTSNIIGNGFREPP